MKYTEDGFFKSLANSQEQLVNAKALATTRA